MGYLSGALRLNWGAFTFAAVLGAACWSAAYSLIGYVFATQITQVAAMIGNAIGVVLAGAVVVVLGVYLWRAWQVEKARAPV
jgi:membrane-associated protein